MVNLDSSNWFGPLFSSQSWTNSENILKNTNFSVDFDNSCRFLNTIPFWLKNCRTNKQIIVIELVCFSGHPRHPPGWYNSGVKEILAKNPSVQTYIKNVSLGNTLWWYERDHPYITSAKGLGGWGRKSAIIEDRSLLHLCWHSEWVGKWVQKIYMLTYYRDGPKRNSVLGKQANIKPEKNKFVNHKLMKKKLIHQFDQFADISKMD